MLSSKPLAPASRSSSMLRRLAAGALAATAFALALPAASADQGTVGADHHSANRQLEDRGFSHARKIADWAAATGDNAGLPFIIIDKKAATLQTFDSRGQLLATSPVLLGSTIGDSTSPGVGNKPISMVESHERTTPAGRFIAERGRNAKDVDVVWIDYDSAVSMHRVINEVASERRLERMATPTHLDNRISYGCINVPVAFYESIIRPMFVAHRAVVYILPEQHSLEQVFGFDERQIASRTQKPR